jgi:four helix bundle protein
MVVERFEDLIAWQKSRDLTKHIYDATQTGAFARDFGLRDQIQRASVSIMSNIAEGFERGSRPEFHHYLVIAKGSCAEVRSQLYVALDVGYLNKQQFEMLMSMAVETTKVLSGLRSSVDPKNNKR